jgi:hypothetical protein
LSRIMGADVRLVEATAGEHDNLDIPSQLAAVVRRRLRRGYAVCVARFAAMPARCWQPLRPAIRSPRRPVRAQWVETSIRSPSRPSG